MSQSSLQAENLHLWRGENHVLRGVGLSVHPGELLQLSGANGAGKTSLLRTLCGLILPEEGQVFWAGRNVRRDLPAFHSSLAYIGHETPLKADLTAAENLHYWIGMRRRLQAADIESALEHTGVGALAQRLVRTLSAGQRRRVALAGLALLAVPLWLLDEPTTNLDEEGRALVGEMIGQHIGQGGIAIAAVHQDLCVPAGQMRTLELTRQ